MFDLGILESVVALGLNKLRYTEAFSSILGVLQHFQHFRWNLDIITHYNKLNAANLLKLATDRSLESIGES